MASWTPLSTSPERLPALRSAPSALRSILIMLSIPPAIGVMGLMGITAWEHWAFAGGVVVVLLATPFPRWPSPRIPQLLQYSRIVRTEAGLEVHAAWRGFRRLPWETIDWISVREVATVYDLFDAVWISVTIGIRGGTPIEVLLPNTQDANLAVFLWELNEEVARRKAADARDKLESNAEVDFGPVRLSRTHLTVREGRRWVTYPLTPWRAVDAPAPLRTFELATESLRNPALFVRWMIDLVPSERMQIDRTSWGGVRRLTIAVEPRA